MKRILMLAPIAIAAAGIIATAGCSLFSGGKAPATIASIEASVVAAHSGYLSLVANGSISTNNTATELTVFNDTMLALKTAEALASGGASAQAPATVLVKANGLTNAINQAALSK